MKHSITERYSDNGYTEFELKTETGTFGLAICTDKGNINISLLEGEDSDNEVVHGEINIPKNEEK